MKADTSALRAALTMLRAQNDLADARPAEGGGWEMHCVRPDGVTILSVTLLPAAFPEGTEGTPSDFVIETDRWLKALRTTGDSTEVEFIDGRVRLSGRGLRHTFRLVEADAENPRRFKVPPIRDRLGAECMVEAERIRSLLASVDEKRTDEMTVVIRPSGLMVSSYDDAQDGVDLTVPPEECALLEGEASAAFPLEAWTEMMRALPPDTVLDIHLGVDLPVMAELGDRTMDATWLCAPRIHQE